MFREVGILMNLLKGAKRVLDQGPGLENCPVAVMS